MTATNQTAKKVARKARAAKVRIHESEADRAERFSRTGTDKFAKIENSIAGMSLAESTKRFGVIEDARLIGAYEQGAILNFAAKYRFPKEKAGFQKWVLTALQIDLGLAGRLMRIHKAVVLSGVEEEDLNGISSSSLLLLVPIMVAVKKHHERLPELLKLARTSTVEDLKAEVYKVRGISTSETNFYGKSVKSLHALGNKLVGEGYVFAYYMANAEGKVTSDTFHRVQNSGPFMKVWKRAVSALGAVQLAPREKVAAKAKKVAAKAKKVSAKAAEMVQNEIDFDNDAQDVTTLHQ